MTLILMSIIMSAVMPAVMPAAMSAIMPVTVMKAAVFLFLFAGFALLCGRLRENRALERTARTAWERVNRSVWKRRKGQRREDALTARLDSALQYSGLRTAFPFLTTEWFLITLAAAGAAGYFLTFLLTRRLSLGLLAFLGIPGALLGAAAYLGYRNYRKTEEQLLLFLNLLGSYSITASDLSGIFLKVSRYLEAPLRPALESCFYEAQTGGDLGMALLHLSQVVEHPRFRELIRNLEVCCRYDADYGSVVKDSRKGIQDFLAYRSQRRSLAEVAKIEMLFLAGAGAATFALMGSILKRNIWKALLATGPGRMIVLALLAVLAVFYLQIVLFDKK